MVNPQALYSHREYTVERREDIKLDEGGNLKQMRETLGLTQAELGKLAGISNRTIGFYETGVRNVGRNNGPKIARALGLPVVVFWRFLRSGGESEAIRTVSKVDEIKNKNDAEKLLKAFQKIIDLYHKSLKTQGSKDIFEHLMRGIEIMAGLSNKFHENI